MKDVFIHFHSKGEMDWINTKFQFTRIPIEGEYITKEVDGEWYKVEMVVHTPFSKEMCAEIYVVKVNHSEELNIKLNINN